MAPAAYPRSAGRPGAATEARGGGSSRRSGDINPARPLRAASRTKPAGPPRTRAVRAADRSARPAGSALRGPAPVRGHGHGRGGGAPGVAPQPRCGQEPRTQSRTAQLDSGCGTPQAGAEPAMRPRTPGSQTCPGLHRKHRGQQGRRGCCPSALARARLKRCIQLWGPQPPLQTV